MNCTIGQGKLWHILHSYLKAHHMRDYFMHFRPQVATHTCKAIVISDQVITTMEVVLV